MKNNLGDNVAFLFSTREHIASVIYMCVNGEDKWDIIDNSNSYLLEDNFNGKNSQIELFMLHQKWLGEINTKSTCVRVLQNRTGAILDKLGFSWSVITKSMFRNLI